MRATVASASRPCSSASATAGSATNAASLAATRVASSGATPAAAKRAAVVAAASATAPTRSSGSAATTARTPGRKRSTVGPELERLRVTHQPPRRPLDQSPHEQEHLVLHRGGHHEVERVDRGPRVGGVEHVARDDVRPRQ